MNSSNPSMVDLCVMDKPELELTAVAHSLTTLESLDGTKVEYERFLSNLETEWPSKRISDFIVARKREQYQKTAYLLQKLELDNRDARVKGMSYKDREKAFTAKIKLGHEYIQSVKRQGVTAKTTRYSVRTLINPLDMGFIQTKGFERFLELYLV